MRNYFKGTFYRCAKLFIGFAIGAFLFVSCVDNKLENTSPEWLGSSIYDYLKTDGHFTNYAKLVEDLGYTDVLSKTGSKTLFVTNDSAFNEFYKSNVWGVKNYDQFTLSQKKLILNFGMINNALLIEMMSNFNNGSLVEGAAMRRETAVSVLDSLTFDNGSKLPDSPYWNYYKTNGIHILKDNTPWTTVYFTQKQLDQAQISNEDFSTISGFNRVGNDAHVFGIKILKRDVTCKNGYLNVLQSVLVPPVNMAEHVYTNPKMTMFSKLLERFSAPYYDGGSTVLYRQLHPEFTDSIFTKRYFAKASGNNASLRYPSGLSVNPDLLLPFDPGWNSYARTTSGYALESDMGTMFVPNNDAMIAYFNSPVGAVLKDRFGAWDNVPTDILPLFLKRHIRTSFIESVPSRFSKMVDEDNSVLPVSKDDIEKSYIGSNGIVYETNKVYPPDDYNSVYGPVLLSANDASPVNKTKIWKWAIVQNDFRLYLNSLVSKYSFFVPTDEYFSKYIDPIAIGKDVPGALRYWYNSKALAVYATVYKFDKVTGQVGDSVGLITSPTFLINRLLDLLNTHIVVGGVETGKGYYLTKGNVALKVTGSGSDMTIQSGENMSLNEKVKVTKVYNQSNGNTYFIDKPIQAPLSSVYKVLSQTPEFSAFYSLLIGFPATGSSIIFVNKTNYFGIDFNIKFFNTFNYTVYVPTNDAINKAISDGLIKPWDTQGSIIGINQLTDATEKANAILNLERFIRYHFQDNSVFIDSQSVNYIYQSATIKSDDVATHFGTFKNKYYRIGITSNGGDLKLTTESNNTANVITSNGLYNIMTRDYVFNGKLSSFKNPDGTGSGTEFSSSLITTSSTAVIHQIDKVLTFK